MTEFYYSLNAVFEESTDHNGTTYWKVFEHVEGFQARTVLVGEITINVDGYESNLLFAGISGDVGNASLTPEADRFFAGHIESRFIYQLAEFMRETEKRLVETDHGLKLVK
jgi:hypothetical protein